MSKVYLKKAGRGLRKFLFFLELTTLVLGLVFGPIANALQMQINGDLDLRSTVQEHTLHRVGVLKSGSIVDVPSSFVVRGSDHEPSPELTLNNWLAKAGFEHGKINSTIGNATSDFFFPIRIVKAADGSDTSKIDANGNYYVALRSLLLQKNGVMVTEGDAPVFPSSDFKPLMATSRNTPPPQTETPDENAGDARPATTPDASTENTGAPTAPAETQLEGRAGCPDGSCNSADEPQFQKLIDLMSRPLQNLEQTRAGYARRTNVQLLTIGEEFMKTCGLNIHRFLPVLIHQSNGAGIPPEFMLSMMMQESGGNCHAVANESNGTQSSGLFQINSKSSAMPRCSVEQKKAIQSLNSGNMETGPRCLENPAINLSEAIRVLKAKMKALQTPHVRIGSQTFTGFDPKEMIKDGKYTTDAWRLAFAAYNGGERWVMQAKLDLEAFNKKQGTHLRATDWEKMRVFFMRAWLKRDPRAPASGSAADPQVEYFGGRAPQRSQSASRSNMAWTENIIPRDPQFRESDLLTMTDSWRKLVEK